MKLASGEAVVWLIIAIVVAISKGLGKLKAPAQPPETGDDDTSPPPPPVRRPRPATGVPVRRPQEQSAPPIVRPGIDDAQRQAPPRDFRELLAQLTNPPVKAAAIPPKVATPPTPKREQPKAVEEPKPIPPQPTAPAVNRNSQWASALRDPSNLRNIIIAAEIIGPPRGA